jgi:hypothetical protein
MADYQLITPWQAETWLPDGDLNTPYARLAGRPNANGIGRITDIGRGVSLLINGSTVTENRTPSQDDLAAADQYFLGGHEYVVDQATADILIAAGYSDYLTVIP